MMTRGGRDGTDDRQLGTRRQTDRGVLLVFFSTRDLAGDVAVRLDTLGLPSKPPD